MKPSEHPEFFTRLPPEGRSRESSLRIDREGRFFQGEEPVEHEGMAEAFARWVDVHPLDGRYILNNGYDWTYVTVEDRPLAVRHARVADATLWVQLTDGSEQPLSPAQVRFGAEGQVYCSVRGGQLEARFQRQAQLALGELLVEDPAGVWLRWGPHRVPVPPQQG